jgi:hypothetical protein
MQCGSQPTQQTNFERRSPRDVINWFEDLYIRYYVTRPVYYVKSVTLAQQLHAKVPLEQ